MVEKSICFVTTGNIAEISTAKRALGMADYLFDLRWNVYILLQDTSENRHRVKLECSENIKILYFQKSSVINERKAKEKYIKVLQPNIIYICAFVIRNIVGIHSKAQKIVEHCELASKFKAISSFRKIYYYGCEFYSLFYADKIIAASKYLQQVYCKRAKKIGKGNIQILYLPYAYNSKIFNFEKSSGIIKNAQYKYFVYLGNLEQFYGVYTMLDAFKLFKDTNVKLLLLGKGSRYNEVLEYIKNHDMESLVEAPGYVAEEKIQDYFALADAFLLPLNDTIQDWARCPSKLYMYLPFKKPVITCQIGEPYEVLQEKGIYFKPSDSISLANAVKSLLDSNNWSLNIDFKKQEWQQRAIQLDSWLRNNENSPLHTEY